MKKRSLLLLLLLFTLIGFALAHQPRLVFKQPIGQITQIQNPEDSQAFYGILSGQEDIYQIVADTGFLLYVNLVVPNMSGSRTDFTVDIIQGDTVVYARLDGRWFVWTNFFEPFGGDSYLQWPSRERIIERGIYTISVNNPENQGKYSLAIGKKERFPIKEIINIYKVMPELKIVFFEKPWYMIFRSRIWLFILWTIIVGVVLILAWIKSIKYIR